MRLVHITSSLKIGGAEHILHTIAAHFDPSKFDQHVIYFHEGPYLAKFKALNIPTYKISGLFFRYDPIFFYRLYRTIKKLDPDCVHTLLWVANFAGRICAWKLNIPCVSVFHNDLSVDGKVRNVIDWLTLRFADRLVAVSDPVKNSVQAKFGGAKKIEVIENGIQLNPSIHFFRFAQKTLRANGESASSLQEIELKKNNIIGVSPFVLRTLLRLPKEVWNFDRNDRRIEGWRENNNQFIIGTVGRFEPVKRYDLLLAVAAPILKKHLHVRLCLIGLGSQEHQLRNLVHELGIADQVIFLIGVPALEYYHLFDCFVQTTAAEGISIALLEAMSFGVPSLVMHENPAHPVITHNENGLVVNSADFLGFGEWLERLIVDEQLRVRLGAEGRKAVRERFDARVMVKRYERLFSSFDKNVKFNRSP